MITNRKIKIIRDYYNLTCNLNNIDVFSKYRLKY